MTDTSFDSVLESLDAVVDSSGGGRGDADLRTALVVSCSMAQCRHDLSLWPVKPSWNTQLVTTLGAQTWVRHDGGLVVDETLTHATAERDVNALLVVGHTGCDVFVDAYERRLAPTDSSPPGIRTRLDPLVSLVDEAVDAGLIDETTPPRTAQYRLVEYNVVRQVAFLTDRLPPSTRIVGYVHDEDGVYGSFPGKQYLISVDGETDPAQLDAKLPADESVAIGTLCCRA